MTNPRTPEGGAGAGEAVSRQLDCTQATAAVANHRVGPLGRPQFAPDTVGYEELRLLAEVYRLVDKAVALAGGSVPPVGSPAWWAAKPQARIASLLVLAEAYLVTEPHLIARMIKDASVAISSSENWSAVGSLPSHAELVRRRAEPGMVWGTFDPVAAARWVETGSSEEPVA